MSITNVESIGKNTEMPFWGLRWRNLAPKTCRDDVWFKGLDRRGNDLFETQLLGKFQPNPTIESKVMHSGSPCTTWDPHAWMVDFLVVNHGDSSMPLNRQILQVTWLQHIHLYLSRCTKVPWHSLTSKVRLPRIV